MDILYKTLESGAKFLIVVGYVFVLGEVVAQTTPCEKLHEDIEAERKEWNDAEEELKRRRERLHQLIERRKALRETDQATAETQGEDAEENETAGAAPDEERPTLLEIQRAEAAMVEQEITAGLEQAQYEKMARDYDDRCS